MSSPDNSVEVSTCVRYEVLQKQAKEITGLNFSTSNGHFVFNFVGDSDFLTFKSLEAVDNFLTGFKMAKRRYGKNKKLIIDGDVDDIKTNFPPAKDGANL